MLAKAKVVARGIPEPTRSLREEIIRKTAESGKDMLISQKIALEAEIARLQEEIKKICTHPFVVSYDGYCGSRSRGYEDCRYGKRVCLVCAFTETSKSTDRDNYQTLTEGSERVVTREREVFPEKRGVTIPWMPEEKLLLTFLDEHVLHLLKEQEA